MLTLTFPNTAIWAQGRRGKKVSLHALCSFQKGNYGIIRREVLAKTQTTARGSSNYFPINPDISSPRAEIKTELLSPLCSFHLIDKMRAASAAKGTQQETASPLTFHTPSSPLADWISQLIPATDYWYTILPVELSLMTYQLAKHLSFLMSMIHSIWVPYTDE